MAGLSEGGNEPPGSLKARDKQHEPSAPQGMGLHYSLLVMGGGGGGGGDDDDDDDELLECHRGTRVFGENPCVD
ncbi:hypothetical protein ANN_01613 [Periplaneta americana]|uniref:Uncharacterized protein n=1 Tax=Periplaneta americana TaxID=6978 RepID=A0ABQ8TU15_PERAM|nr:hypothetical protein ANN_01613 [Periplaneta americana]